MLQPEGKVLLQRPILLLTRPEAQSRRFADDLARLLPGAFETIISPLTRIEYLDHAPDLKGVSGLVFTSENGVAGFARVSDRRDLPAWTVGPRTASAARHLGFVVRSGPGDAAGLAKTILEHRPAGALLYVRGHETAFPLSQELTKGGLAAREIVLYDQPFVAPTSAAKAALSGRQPVVVPLFSSRAAQALVRLAEVITAPLHVAAISESVAREAATLRPKRLSTAATPDGGSMLAAAAALIRDSQQG